jgi:hypothetical protein
VSAASATAWRPAADAGLFERTAQALLGVGVALVSAYVMLRALGVLPPGALLPQRAADGPALGWIEQLPTWGRTAAAGGALLVGLTALAVTLSVRNGRRSEARGGVHVLEADERGLILVAHEGIESLARAAVARTPGVVESDVRVRSRGDGVSLVVDIGVVELADVRKAGLAARDRAVEAAKKLAGLVVRDVQVRVEVLSPEELGRAVL